MFFLTTQTTHHDTNQCKQMRLILVTCLLAWLHFADYTANDPDATAGVLGLPRRKPTVI